MNKKEIIIYEIKYILTKFILPFMFFLFYLFLLVAKPFPNNINTMLIIILLFPFLFVSHFVTGGSCRNNIKENYCEVFECCYDDIHFIIEKIKKNAKQKGYLYEKQLKTDVNEVFIINSTDENDFPVEKIGIYVNNVYNCEYYKSGGRYTSGSYVPGEGKTHYLYKPFFKMICGKYGRNYDFPRDWVNIEATIFVIVDEWNDALNWALNNGGHLPFVLFGVIVRSEGNKLFIAQDNRKVKRDDYFYKRKEMFDLIELNNRNSIGKLSWRDVYKKIKDKK